MSGKTARAKGAAAEREVVKILEQAGFPAHRTPYSGGLWWMKGDVTGTPWYVEVKRCETTRIDEWCRKAEVEAKGKPALLIYRRSHEPWRVVLLLDTFLGMVKS
jgi:Holliday junction resolvase